MIEVIYYGGKYQIIFNKSKIMQLTLPESLVFREILPLKNQGRLVGENDPARNPAVMGQTYLAETFRGKLA